MFAVELYFDPASDTAIRRVWQAIADAGLPSHLLAAGYRPHVSLAVCRHLDVDRFAPLLAAYTQTVMPFDIALVSLGVFPTAEGVLFYGATVTRTLLDMHAKFYQLFEEVAENQVAYYQVGAWVPHCTLAYGLKPVEIASAVEACISSRLPISARVVEAGIAEASPTHHRIHYLARLGWDES